MNVHEVVNDFARRWTGTYVWLYMENLGREVLVKITSVEEHPKKIATITITSKEYGDMKLNFGSDASRLKFKYPPVGVFQHGTDAVMMQRRPARQWRRGLCSDNANLIYTHRYLSAKSLPWDLAAVQAAFDHKIMAKEDALRMLNKGLARSVAMDNEFSLCLSTNLTDTGHVLFHWGEPVAVVSEKDGSVKTILNDHYKQLVESQYVHSF